MYFTEKTKRNLCADECLAGICDLAHKHLQTSQNLNSKILVLCSSITLILK